MERRLLIVDDDPLMTDSLEFLLQQEGYDVAVAPTGSDALEAVPNRPHQTWCSWTLACPT